MHHLFLLVMTQSLLGQGKRVLSLVLMVGQVTALGLLGLMR